MASLALGLTAGWTEPAGGKMEDGTSIMMKDENGIIKIGTLGRMDGIRRKEEGKKKEGRRKEERRKEERRKIEV